MSPSWDHLAGQAFTAAGQLYDLYLIPYRELQPSLRWRKHYCRIRESWRLWRNAGAEGTRYWKQETKAPILPKHVLTRLGDGPTNEDIRTPYVYEKLPTDTSFRCYELAPGRLNDPISGKLITTNLEDHQTYETVSYCWYGATRTFHLPVSDQFYIPTTPHVAAILQHLRLASETRCLWIDAVCINQDDIDERAFQVRLMGRIYNNANRLNIWLGLENKSTHATFEMMRYLDEIVAKVYLVPRPLHHQYEALKVSGLPEPSDRRWCHFQALFQSQWFTRTWILQEVLLAKYAWIQCGFQCIEWTRVYRLLNALRETRVLAACGLEIPWATRLCTFYACWSLSQGLSLLTLLRETIHTSVSQPEDKVFGLIGIACDGDQVRSIIDYNKRVEDVYLEVAIFYLELGDLHVLNLASDPSERKLQGLPTWVPDWSSWRRPWPMFLPVIPGGPEEAGQVIRPQHCKPSVVTDRRYLRLRGLVTDKVLAGGMSMPINSNVSIMMFIKIFLKQWYKIGKRYARFNPDTFDQEFVHTVSKGWHCAREDGPNSLETYRAFLKVTDNHLRTDWHAILDRKPTNADIASLSDALRDLCAGRSFFTTEKGLMGMGPTHVRPDDAIAIVDGGISPYVIRSEENGRYSLVGECYIHNYDLGDWDFWARHADEIILS